ncbi:MAG: B12-binding domain-containing radical SAM protein [Candidatus Magnetominusculus sp. LBB02]|nr:B12-binding domain-containing radical SAM protein [Candidatus Magnetominusculus sp. LBB02]
MKVLLIQPFPYKISINDRYTERIPLGIQYIGDIIKDRLRQEIRILDLSIKDSNFDLSKYLIDYAPDVVGISIHSTYIAPVSFTIAEIVKIVLPDCIMLAGGAHASADPYHILKNRDFDIVVRGEGEEIVYNLLRLIMTREDINNVQGIIYRRNEELIDNGFGSLPNMDLLPPMPSTLINIDDYQLKVPYMPEGKTLNLITSRGCPYRCSFCSYKSISGTQHRFKTAENLVSELERAKINYGISNFYFLDDNFLLDNNRILAIQNILRNRKLRIYWRCQARADSFVKNSNLAELISGMGCTHISFGIESGDQQVLNIINKNLYLDSAKQAIFLAKQNGILVRLFLMVGLPFQDVHSIQKTIDFLYETQPDEISVSIFVPFQGSPIYADLSKWGISFVNNDLSNHLYREDWLSCPTSNNVRPIIETKWLTSDEIFDAKIRIEQAFESVKGQRVSSCNNIIAQRKGAVS